MSQQQAVHPIVLKQENGELVLKIVLESPKQETQTLILQQPDGKEFTMSTDTTAIWSFVLAMVVAFILGVSATVIAIWYGRKSFSLTKQSFDIVLKQIEANKIDAINNREITVAQIDSSKEQILASNSQLIDIQVDLKIREIRAQRRLDFIEKVRNEMSALSSLIDHEVLMLMEFGSEFYRDYGKNYKISQIGLEMKSKTLNDKLERMNKKRLEIKSSLERLRFLLDSKNKLHKEIWDLWNEYFENYEQIRFNVLDNADITNIEKIFEISVSLGEKINFLLSQELNMALKGE